MLKVPNKKTTENSPVSPAGAGLHMDVAVDLPVFQPYTYLVPASLADFAVPGKRVLVPVKNRRVTGYLLEAAPPPEKQKAKRILDILDEAPLFSAAMLPFFRWVSEYYIHPLGMVIKTGLPGGLNLHDYELLTLTDEGEKTLSDGTPGPLEQEVLHHLSRGPCPVRDLTTCLKQTLPATLIQTLARDGKIARTRKLTGGTTRIRTERHVTLPDPPPTQECLTEKRRAIVDILAAEGTLPVATLKERIPGAAGILTAMAKSELVRIEQRPVYRDPLGETVRRDRPPIATPEQTDAVAAVVEALGKGFSAFLLAGVTGSGKTEVYLQAAAAAVDRGHSVLVLVPEIALISQTERRFRARFGDVVAILHSGLSAGQRFDQWRRIAAGEVKIAVGTRSAVFAPFESPGLIIVDEEHDPSYKQETGLRYNARDLAVMRAQKQGTVALLGSATPSIQSYFNVQQQKFKVLSLSKRVAERPLPEITVVDLKSVRGVTGVQSFITPELHKALARTLSRGEQSLLFLNRRGYANYPVCRECGNAISCDHCDISLTLHQKSNAYRCHFCGFSRAATSACPTCGSRHILLMGLGTEKVEAGIQALFPTARVARMDRDTTARKGAMVSLLKGLKDRTIDILVGTQMVAKGHDFPYITLVGVICADLSLNFPDFRAGERTFQLLAQVAGRAGRGNTPGRVILQTYNPEHFSILSAQAQDFMSFYDREIGFRRALRYPPFSRLAQIRITGKEKDRTQARALELGKLCRHVKAGDGFKGAIDVLGPIEAPLLKIAGRYRWQILIKGAGVQPLHRFIRALMAENPAAFNGSQPTVGVDVDPYDML
jgi:primosomal protein N' (replication factor Y)